MKIKISFEYYLNSRAKLCADNYYDFLLFMNATVIKTNNHSLCRHDKNTKNFKWCLIAPSTINKRVNIEIRSTAADITQINL